jgi:DNA-binding CsgD family transcriptional regulator
MSVDSRTEMVADGLIGRSAEFAAIGAALRRPDLAGVVLVGDAGVGKSHLLGAALRHAGHMGFATVLISGTRALADIPLAAFASLLPSRLSGDAGDLVQVRRSLQQLAGGRPLLLGVDDAHLVDEASAALVHQLAAELSAFVLASARSGESAPEAITAMIKDGLAIRVALEPFDRMAMVAFAERTVGGQIDHEVEHELWERTLGNPLFARELLLQARDRADLVYRDERYRLEGGFSAPETLSDLVDSRLAGLSDDHQRAAALVAVGGPLEVDLLERLVDPDSLVELEEARVLAADEVGDTLVVRFVHPVYADATRRRLGRLAARQMLRELADTLERAPRRRPEDLLRIATWRHGAGADADPAQLLQAARLAARRHDHSLAEELATHSFELEPTLRSAVVIAGAQIEQGNYDEAQTWLRHPRLDVAAASPADRYRAGLVESSVEFWGLGRAMDARAVLDHLGAEFPDQRAVLDAYRGALAAGCARPREALALVPVGSPAGETSLGAFAILTALTSLGRPEAALAAVPKLPDPVQQTAGAIVAASYAFALVDAGRVDDALALGADGWERASRDGDLHGRVAWAIANGWASATTGRSTAAARWFADAADLARRSAASTHGVRWALGGTLLTSAIAGDIDTACAVRARLDRLGPHDAVVHAAMEHRGRAWLLAAEHGPAAAIEQLEELAAAELTHGNVTSWLRLVADIARLGRGDLAARLVDVQRPEVEGPYLRALLDLLVAHGAGEVESTGDAADRLWECGARVLAAEGAAWAWGHARDAGGDVRDVAQLGRHAQERREQIDVHATPALTVAPPEVSLSRREREIALLVAEGRTSREVADELIIGVRTVESHLARVYAKLGVRSRVELAEALEPRGAVA